MQSKISTLTFIAVMGLLASCSQVESAASPSLDLGNQAETADTAIKTASLQGGYSAPSPFQARRCINMGNALEADNEGDWGYKIQARHFQYIKQAGFDTVRVPIKWDAHTQTRPPFMISRPFMERVKQVVGQAQANGLGVIIDVHHYEDFINNPRREFARFQAIWGQISTVFRGAPSNVYFELLNEPTRAISNSDLNQIYAEIIPMIRRTNPTRPIIIGGNSWNSVDTMSQINWPQDLNVIATFHDYGPHEFTHQGAEWMDPIFPMGRNWGSRADYQELKETYVLANNFASRARRQIFVGEFGVIDRIDGRKRAEWLAHRRRAMESSGFSWCVWDFAGAFSLFDLSNNRWRPGVVEALTGRY